MSETTDISYYIALIVTKELKTEYTKTVYGLIRNAIPDGVGSTVQVASPSGGLAAVSLVVKKTKTDYRYYFPLTRNLIESEAEPIVKLLSRKMPGLDFDLMVSKSEIEDAPECEKIALKNEKYKALCQSFAKRQHESWLADRVAAGWRYSTTMSMSDRTSPMLRPWDELPESLRKIDYDNPQQMVDFLNEQGYAVVRKEELAAIYSLLARNI